MVRESLKYIVRIVLSIFIIIVSVPLWENSFGAKNIAIVNEYKDADIIVDYGDFDLGVFNKKDIDSINPTKINLKNINGYEKNEYLYLTLDDDTTIDSKYINIRLGQKTYRLENISYEHQNNKKYYLLENIELEAYDSIDIDAIIWIDESIKNIEDDDILVIDFITKPVRI